MSTAMDDSKSFCFETAIIISRAHAASVLGLDIVEAERLRTEERIENMRQTISASERCREMVAPL